MGRSLAWQVFPFLLGSFPSLGRAHCSATVPAAKGDWWQERVQSRNLECKQGADPLWH